MTPSALADLFTTAGTVSAAPPPTPASIVIGPLVGRQPHVEALRSTGVLLVTPDALGLQRHVLGLQRHLLDVGTQLAIPADPTRPSGQTDFAIAVKELRSRSGLTWQELADAIGVSRRAVHHWASGARVSAAHARLIQELAELVEEASAPTSVETRAQLLAPQTSGLSALAAFRAAARPRRSTPLSTLSVADVLTNEPLQEPPPPPRPQRRSRIAPRRIGPGRSATE
jgi:transcriptional regulator with XRE-family HTH domain